MPISKKPNLEGAEREHEFSVSRSSERKIGDSLFWVMSLTWSMFLMSSLALYKYGQSSQ